MIRISSVSYGVVPGKFATTHDENIILSGGFYRVLLDYIPRIDMLQSARSLNYYDRFYKVLYYII
jgi:hypothetical protein